MTYNMYMYVDKVCIFLFIFYNTEGSGVLRDFGTWWLLISGGSFKYVIPILFYPRYELVHVMHHTFFDFFLYILVYIEIEA